MNVHNVGSMSLGQWSAICRQWNRAHGDKADMPAPSDEEFDAAVMAARAG